MTDEIGQVQAEAQPFFAVIHGVSQGVRKFIPSSPRKIEYNKRARCDSELHFADFAVATSDRFHLPWLISRSNLHPWHPWHPGQTH